jgi:putative Holliday junction resolvase
MRILGIDYGRCRFGLALSDEDGTLASPLPPQERSGSLDSDLAALSRLIRDRQVARLVVGLPLNMNGSSGGMAKEALAFAEQLRTRTGLPVETADERLTSEEAERVLIEGHVSRGRRKTLRDGLAAVLILQCYLDQHRVARRPLDPGE